MLQCPYPFEKAKLIVREMAELLVLDLVEKELVTDQMTLTVGYDIDNLSDPEIRKSYHEEITTDCYGRSVPKHTHGSANLERQTSYTKLVVGAVKELFDRIVDPKLLVRRVNLTANYVVSEADTRQAAFQQLDLFSNQAKSAEETAALKREKRIQQAVVSIKKKYGKNAALKGMNLEEGATTIERNRQVEGHKAWRTNMMTLSICRAMCPRRIHGCLLQTERRSSLPLPR